MGHLSVHMHVRCMCALHYKPPANDKRKARLTYQRFRCRIPHYIENFLAPADKLIPIAVFLCPSMYDDLIRICLQLVQSEYQYLHSDLAVSPRWSMDTLLLMSTPSRCDRQTPPTGAQQPPPFFSIGSPLHDFKDTVSRETPALPPPSPSKASQSLWIIHLIIHSKPVIKPNECGAYRTNELEGVSCNLKEGRLV